eukprot:582995-Pleurochrysis_carterae.AAC.1
MHTHPQAYVSLHRRAPPFSSPSPVLSSRSPPVSSGVLRAQGAKRRGHEQGGRRQVRSTHDQIRTSETLESASMTPMELRGELTKRVGC